jgi:HSP20 family protein
MLPVRRDRGWLPDIFSDYFDNEWMMRTNATAPAINVIETDTEYKVEMAAPGMIRDDFSTRINDQNQLIVTMERQTENGCREIKPEAKMDAKEKKSGPRSIRHWKNRAKAVTCAVSSRTSASSRR